MRLEISERERRELFALILILPILWVWMFIVPFVRAHIIAKRPIEDGIIAGVGGIVLSTVAVLIAFFVRRESQRRK